MRHRPGNLTVWTSTLLISLALALSGCGDDSDSGGGSGGDGGSGGTPGGECSVEAPEALRTCVLAVNDAWESCYESTGAPCTADDENVASALSALETTVSASCADDEFGSLTAEGVVGRLRNACASEANSLAWRTFGGPQGAVYPDVPEADQACLLASHGAVSTMVDASLAAINTCLAAGDCDGIDVERESLADTARTSVEGACADLAAIIAVGPAEYVSRAAHQVDCMTATGHADTGTLTLGCGPTNTDFEPTRGEYVQIVVDGEKWGTMCGDGTEFAFQVRLAPEGQPLDRIIVGLQGGGVCAFYEDCAARFESNPGLFNAMDDQPTSTGIASNDPEVSPFANWTKVYVPYCNQDVFAGGGVVEELVDGEDSLDLPRYGSSNMRAAVQMVRDVIWKAIDAEGGEGFRPDEVVALFGGWSAGGYGALYNYHWFLDDLQWPRTTAFPDASGALDNEMALGVRGLGILKIPAWGMLPNLPPYCFAGACALGPVLYEAISPRLLQVPQQQMLILSNQWDDTQRRDAFFNGFGETTEFWQAEWFNTMRRDFCDTRDLPGIHYYYTGVTAESTHVVTLRPELWEGSVAGEVMRDWFERAIEEPDTVESRTEEGDWVNIFDGVQPYPCTVAP
ncbi:MAG: pectin acetylesterase-family hydrolase [Myxococcota bacterium]